MLKETRSLELKEAITFDDVLLAPQLSDITSRTEVDLSTFIYTSSTDVTYAKFDLPIISSPMDTVTEEKMATCMSKAGGLGIIHRYNTIQAQCEMIGKVQGAKAAAIGMTGDYRERAAALFEAGARILCIDVAHGHHTMMERCLGELKSMLNNSVYIIAGNVATAEGYSDLADWGADCVRVGIGGGSICSTRLVSGHGVPTLQSVVECYHENRAADIIADGGIKTSGDMVKAFAAGADFVMVGSLLAGTSVKCSKVARAKATKFIGAWLLVPHKKTGEANLHLRKAFQQQCRIKAPQKTSWQILRGASNPDALIAAPLISNFSGTTVNLSVRPRPAKTKATHIF